MKTEKIGVIGPKFNIQGAIWFNHMRVATSSQGGKGPPMLVQVFRNQILELE